MYSHIFTHGTCHAVCNCGIKILCLVFISVLLYDINLAIGDKVLHAKAVRKFL